MESATRDEAAIAKCPECGSDRLSRQLVRSAIWHGERLVLVDDIPAVVCGACGERFFDDATATVLDLMQGEGFPAERAKGHLHVPIFSFSHRVPAELLDVAETEE
jgi:YgiT-type zinc finger domain-containing protein